MQPRKKTLADLCTDKSKSTIEHGRHCVNMSMLILRVEDERKPVGTNKLPVPLPLWLWSYRRAPSSFLPSFPNHPTNQTTTFVGTGMLSDFGEGLSEIFCLICSTNAFQEAARIHILAGSTFTQSSTGVQLLKVSFWATGLGKSQQMRPLCPVLSVKFTNKQLKLH